MLTPLQPHGLEPTRLLCLWDFLGKNTGVGCHLLLQGIFPTQGSNLHLLFWQEDSLPLSHQGRAFTVCVLSRFSHAQLFATPWTVARQAPLSMGFSRQEILEWVAISYSKRSSQLRGQSHVSYVSCIGRQVLYR